MSTSINPIINAVSPLAEQAGIDAESYYQTLYQVVFSGITMNERTRDTVINVNHMHQLVHLCRQYGINPLLNHVYAVVTQGIIRYNLTVDGWMQVLLSNQEYKHHEIIFAETSVPADLQDHCVPEWIQVKIEFKDGRTFNGLREYYRENNEGTDNWIKRPIRLLTHRALCQAIRYGLGVSGFAADTDQQIATPQIHHSQEQSVDSDNIQVDEEVTDVEVLPVNKQEVITDTDATFESPVDVVIDDGPEVDGQEPRVEVEQDHQPEPESAPQSQSADDGQEEVKSYTVEWSEFVAKTIKQHGSIGEKACVNFEVFLDKKGSSFEALTEYQWKMAQQFVNDKIKQFTSAIEGEEDFSKYNFALISSVVRQIVMKTAEQARVADDLAPLKSLEAAFQTDTEKAFVRKQICELRNPQAKAA